MLKGMQGLVWESSEAFLWTPSFPSKGVCCMTSDVAKEKAEEGLTCMEGSPWGQGPTLQHLSSSSVHCWVLGHCTLVSFLPGLWFLLCSSLCNRLPYQNYYSWSKVSKLFL